MDSNHHKIIVKVLKNCKIVVVQKIRLIISVNLIALMIIIMVCLFVM